MYTKIPKMNLFKNLEQVLICVSNSIWNLAFLVKTKLYGFCFGKTFILGEKGKSDFYIVQMNLERI